MRQHPPTLTRPALRHLSQNVEIDLGQLGVEGLGSLFQDVGGIHAEAGDVLVDVGDSSATVAALISQPSATRSRSTSEMSSAV